VCNEALDVTSLEKKPNTGNDELTLASILHLENEEFYFKNWASCMSCVLLRIIDNHNKACKRDGFEFAMLEKTRIDFDTAINLISWNSENTDKILNDVDDYLSDNNIERGLREKYIETLKRVSFDILSNNDFAHNNTMTLCRKIFDEKKCQD